MLNAAFGLATGALGGLTFAQKSDCVFSGNRKGRNATLSGGVT